MSASSEAMAARAVSDARLNAWKGLLWREWLARRRLVVGALAVWLACGWVILLFYDPGWIIAFGVLYAFLAGPSLGGAEVIEGSEEFSFSLPPPRGDRYLVRMAFGGATVLAFTALGVLAIGLDLPQRVWGLFVNSGFTEPFPVVENRFVYPMAVAAPFAVFAFSFAIAAVATTRGTVLASWFLGGILATGTIGAGFACERLLWGVVIGYVSVIALLAVAPLALLWGYLAYQRKEGISQPAPMQGGRLWWVWAIVVAIVLVLMALFWVSARHSSMSEAERPATEATLERSITDGLREQERRRPAPKREVAPHLVPAPPKTSAPSPKDGR